MAWSSVSNAPTLLSSSAAAAGAGAAAVADFVKFKVATVPTTATAKAPAIRRRVIAVLQLFNHFFIAFLLVQIDDLPDCLQLII
jgi:hypothetical protein